MKRLGYLLLAVVGTLGYLLIGCGCETQQPVALSGIVEVRDVRLGFEEAGYLESVAVDVNDAVAKGRVVAALESRELKLELERTRFELKKAQADLENLINTPRPEELAAAKARESAAKAVMENAAEELERSITLYEKRVATAQSHQQRQMQYKTAREAYEAAKAERELIASGSKRELLRAQEMQVKALERSVAAMEVRLEKRRLVAPFSGVVLTRNFEPGEYLQKGQSVLSLGDLGDCWVKIYLPEALLADTAVGQRVTVRFDSQRHPQLEGRISEISQEAAFAPRMNLRKEQRSDLYFPVKVAVENTEQRLKPGMVADVLF